MLVWLWGMPYEDNMAFMAWFKVGHEDENGKSTRKLTSQPSKYPVNLVRLFFFQ